MTEKAGCLHTCLTNGEGEGPGAKKTPTQVDPPNRCHLSNWRFNLETVHLEPKKAFFADHVCVQMLQNKAFWPRFTFHKKPELRRKNHYFYSVRMGEGRNHYENHDLGHNH